MCRPAGATVAYIGVVAVSTEVVSTEFAGAVCAETVVASARAVCSFY